MNSSANSILDISYPKPGKLRSRKVVSRSRARPTGKYPSWKMGRMVQWESVNELNAFRLLDASPEVLSFSEQPVAIKFILDGENLTHYPDVLVQYRNGRELWEIKPKSEAVKPDVVARTLFMQAALPAFGFTYQLVSNL